MAAEREPTVSKLLREATHALHQAGVENARQEARWVLQFGLDRSWESLLADGAAEVLPDARERCLQLLRRRIAGEPLQYVLGTAEFYGIEIEVGPGVLIPRPETERLVDFALEHDRAAGPVCDLCTGSGAIVCALGTHLRRPVQMVATDLCPEALRYARRNLRRLGLLTQVQLLHGDLFAPVAPHLRFSLITANPPYVAPEAYDRLPPDVKEYEPKQALLARDQGLAMVRRIARESVDWLLPGGRILCEISSEQGHAALEIFRNCGYSRVRIRQDYTGRDRVVDAWRP